MSVISRLVHTPASLQGIMKPKLFLSEFYVFSALAQNLVAGRQQVVKNLYSTQCDGHALPINHPLATKNASFAHKAFCEVVFRQNFFHRQQSGACYSTLSSDNGLPWTDIDYDQLKSMIKSKDVQIIDVREREEIEETGMMPGATNVPLGEISEALKLPATEFKTKYGAPLPNKSDGNIIFSCLGGVRSRQALNAAHETGYTKARHYIGGWSEYSDKIESEKGRS